MRKGTSYCGIKAVAPERDQIGFIGDSDMKYALTWCGQSELTTSRRRGESLKLVTCNKCSAAIGKAKLKELGGRVRLEAAKDVHAYLRSLYAIYIDDVKRGYLAYSGGWGKGGWALHRLAGPGDYGSDDRGPSLSGRGPMSRWDAARILAQEREDKSVSFWPVHYASKEAFAVAAFKAWESGDLPTVEELIAKHERRHKEREQERIATQEHLEAVRRKREELEAIRLANVEAWQAGLAALESRGDLTNVERAGLEAIKELYQ